MRIEVVSRITLDAPNEETGKKYVDEMLEDMADSTVLNLEYSIEATKQVEGT